MSIFSQVGATTPSAMASPSGVQKFVSNLFAFQTAGLAKYPDRPIGSLPSGPLSMRFLVEHRRALNGKTVTVQGIVVQAVAPTDERTTGGEAIMANPQPRIFIADAQKQSRDKNLDLTVLFRENDQLPDVGQTVTIKVVVDSNKFALVMRKIY